MPSIRKTAVRRRDYDAWAQLGSSRKLCVEPLKQGAAVFCTLFLQKTAALFSFRPLFVSACLGALR